MLTFHEIQVGAFGLVNYVEPNGAQSKRQTARPEFYDGEFLIFDLKIEKKRTKKWSMRLKKIIASRLMVFFVQAIRGQRTEYVRLHLVRGLWLPVDNSISVNVFFCCFF